MDSVDACAVTSMPLDVIPLGTYIAVQLGHGEDTHRVAALYMKTAKGLPLFRRLEVLDTMTLGMSAYVRMRTDDPNPVPILDRLYDAGRGVIHVAAGEYMVRIPGGRFGKVPSLTMIGSAKPGQARLYRGTKIKLWMRQFE